MNQEKPVKITVRLPGSIVEKIEKLSTDTNTTFTATLRRFLDRELFLNAEEARGNRILLEDEKSGKVRQIITR